MYDIAGNLLAEKLLARQHQCEGISIERSEVQTFLYEVLKLFFPGIYSKRKLTSPYEISNELKKITHLLVEIAHPLLGNKPEESERVRLGFLETLPATYEKIWEDAEAAFAGDPAAGSIAEVILAYPGFFAISVHRIAHQFYRLGVPILPRVLTEYAHERTGIDIHPGAEIGRSFFMDHGTGIVIGETSYIGNNVKLYQGVTLGALSVSKELAQKKRHPTIQDNVVIYAGATILGGDTVIGHDSVIGGNVWLTESVPPYSVVYNRSGVRVRTQKELENIIDFSI